MNPNLFFDFSVDKEKNSITVKREFAAGLDLVWDAWTKPELLDLWWAPKPYQARTKSMDFREGGYWLYAMIEPNGTEYWGRMDYLSIQPIESYTAMDAFCNEQGEVNPQLPRANWVVSFADLGEHARVDTVVTYSSLADLETVVQMGMQEGLTSTLERLDELLASLNP